MHQPASCEQTGRGRGMLCGGLGTQVVGCILRPSGFCGAYGFKPSAGGINRGGSLNYLSQNVTGTIAASLADVWAVARAAGVTVLTPEDCDARCFGAQPERAGAACAVTGDDAGGVCGAAGPMRRSPDGSMR